MPGLGDEAGALLKGVDKALKAGDLETASKLINKVSDEISRYLPGPGKISVPTSGVGASAKFSVTNAQIGKNLVNMLKILVGMHQMRPSENVF